MHHTQSSKVINVWVIRKVYQSYATPLFWLWDEKFEERNIRRFIYIYSKNAIIKKMSTLFCALYALKNNNKPGNNIRRLRTIWWDKPHQIHSVSGTESHTLTYTLTLIAHREIFRMTKKKKTTKENVCQKQKIIVTFVLFCGERGRRRWSRTTNDFIIVAHCFDVSSSVGWLVGWFIYEVSSGNIAKTKECPLKLLLLLFYADSAFCLFYCCCTSHVMMSVDLVCVWFYIGMCVCVRALSCVCVCCLLLLICHVNYFAILFTFIISFCWLTLLLLVFVVAVVIVVVVMSFYLIICSLLA